MSSGKVIALIAGIVFCILLGAAITAVGVIVYDQRQEAAAKQAAEAREEALANQEALAQQEALAKEQEVDAKQAGLTRMMQRAYSDNAQQVFLDIHPGGTANSITVSNLKITDWFDGGPTGRMADKDVQGFSLHITINWSSNIHSGDGVTEADDFYTRDSPQEGFRFLRRANIKSNGATKEGLSNLFMRGIGKFLKLP